MKKFDLRKALKESNNHTDFKSDVRAHFQTDHLSIDDPEVKKCHDDEKHWKKCHVEHLEWLVNAGNTPDGQWKGAKKQQNEVVAQTLQIMYTHDVSPRIRLVYKKSTKKDSEILGLARQYGLSREQAGEALHNYTLCTTDQIAKDSLLRIEGEYYNQHKTYQERVGIVPPYTRWEYDLDQDIRIVDMITKKQIGHMDCKNSPKGINATSQAHHCKKMQDCQEAIGNFNYMPWIHNNDFDKNQTFVKGLGQWCSANTPRGERNVLEVYREYGIPVYTPYEDENLIIEQYRGFPVRTKQQYEDDFVNWANMIIKD